MKILLLSDWMSSPGGAETYIVSLRDALRGQGDEARLIACGPDKQGPADVRAYGSDVFAAQALLQIANPFAASRVRGVVRDFRPDAAIVSQFAYHLSPSVFGALQDVPTVVTMMDYKAICPTGTRLLPNGSSCSVRQGAACSSNGCIGYAHALRDRPRYSRIHREVTAGRLILCPSLAMQRELSAAGIDATLVPLGIRATAGVAGPPAPDPVFAYAGRFSREKGVAILMAAFAQVLEKFPAARLRLVGDGPLKSSLQALAGVLGIAGSVSFPGWSSAERIQATLDDAWCVVCPSLWAEPFGLVALEAACFGIPVIASDSGGFPETVGESLGLLFRTGDVASLASAMLSIARGERFAGSRLPPDAIASIRESHGIDAHARRVRGVLTEMLQGRAA
jgi:glycosyltransferase involved in cell wall biosynthesis